MNEKNLNLKMKGSGKVVENDLDEIMCEVREHRSKLVEIDEETRLRIQKENEIGILNGDKILLGFGIAIALSAIAWIVSFGVIKVVLKYFSPDFMF